MKGIGASPGIAIGKAIVKNDIKIDFQKRIVDNVQIENQKFLNALKKSEFQLQSIYNITKKNIGKEEASIFSAHIMILKDPELLKGVESKITQDKCNAEYAVKEVAHKFIEILSNMDDEYMRERALDIKDVTNRIINNILGIKETNLSNIEEGIIIAKELTPSDTVTMDKKNVLGFVTKLGGKTSHCAIIARNIDIPAVVGVKDIFNCVKSGDNLIIDGVDGLVIINPSKADLRYYMDKKNEYELDKQKYRKLIGVETKTKDGIKVEIVGNIGMPEDVDNILNNDGEGVGLFRTEFLYMNKNKLPSEEEQFIQYKKVAEKMGQRPVVIRTLDIGGDKELPYLNLPSELNPFLGYRAIRISLDRQDLFKTQLRALLRASYYGNIKIMFPMISSLEELNEAKKILEEVKQNLKKDNILFDDSLEVGMMIEIPSAAIMSDIFAKQVDFFSIGTNDLIQYTVAVDRGNEDVNHLYNQYHPALLRLIKTVIDNAHKEGIWVGMCGETAGNTQIIPILIGMGLDEFSMSASSILKAKASILNTNKGEMEKIVLEILQLGSADEVESYII